MIFIRLAPFMLGVWLQLPNASLYAILTDLTYFVYKRYILLISQSLLEHLTSTSEVQLSENVVS